MKDRMLAGGGALLVLSASIRCVFAAEPSQSCELRPLLLEEFDELRASANRIGPARWTAHTPWAGDFGEAAFANPGPKGPFKVENGILSITASKDQNGRWTSGLLAAADASGAGTGTRYGYFEARMKMPAGRGTWPAFWLAALKPATITEGNVEIDVIEYYGQFPSAYQAATHIWYKDPQKTRGEAQKIDIPADSLLNEFH